jgi:hypothetical protein
VGVLTVCSILTTDAPPASIAGDGLGTPEQGWNRVGLNMVVSRVHDENPVLVSCRVANCETRDTARFVFKLISTRRRPIAC